MKPLLFFLPGNEKLGHSLSQLLHLDLGEMDLRSFPDGETYLRVLSDCKNKEVLLLATLHRPDQKLLKLIFLAETIRELGAKSVILIAPYLAYMRQDSRFHPGEGVNSRYFARLLSNYFAGLVTLDPHLHRYPSLSEIYSIPTQVVHAAPLLADWIRSQVKKPLLIGPDAESEQWVEDVAQRANAPHIVLNKIRRGDRDVEVSVPDVDRWRSHTPILVDDIISTAHTMIETLAHLRSADMNLPVCIGVHAVFSQDAYENLLKAGAARIITCNTIPHVSNEIEIAEILAGSLLEFLNTLQTKP